MTHPDPASAPDTTGAAKQTDQQARAEDRGHFNQYGMRNDARGDGSLDTDNPGTGEGPRRYGAGGDPASYANRPPADDSGRPAEPVAGPISAVDASGSARALGLDYGGEQHKEPRLSSRQGAGLIGELDRDRKR